MTGAAVRDWEESDSGLVYPGATFGHTQPVHPSAGGERYEAFCKSLIRQSKSRWRDRPLVFYPHQSAFHHELFRTEMGKRVHTEALYGVSRKNGKSTDAAALALYLLFADGEPAPEVYSAAGSRDQAKVVFTEAVRMVRRSPVLSEWSKIYRNEIVVPSIDGVYRAVSADGGLQMGSNPSGVVADELHVWRGDAGRELYYALSTGMIARSNPLIVSITTAGYELDSIAYEVYERMLGVGQVDNPYADIGRSLMYWIGASENADPADPATWMQANPAPWLTERVLGAEFHKRPLAVFERLHLNRWTVVEQLWLRASQWLDLASEARIRPGERVWMGVDIGFKRDASAVVIVARRDGEGPSGKPLYVTQGWSFDPAMQKDGSLDMAPVENLIKKLAVEYNVVECRYDRTLFQRSAEELSERIRMVEVPWSSNQRIVEMTANLYELIVEEQITHDGDPTLAAHVNAAVIRETEAGARVSKAKSQRRIDMLAALLMAIAGAINRRMTAEPGVRLIDSARPALPKPEDAAAHPLARLTLERVRSGSIAPESDAEQYEAIIRPALESMVARAVEEEDDLRKRLAIREMERLDERFRLLA